MDITDLNLFVWCKCLRHLGRTIMFLVVAGIVTLAAYSTISSSLIPGMESPNAASKAGYAILTAIYVIIVAMVFWSYLATIFTEPGSVPPGWHPFILGDLETGSACPSVLDPSFAPRLAQLFDFPETLTATAAGRDPEEHARAKMERPRWCKKCQGWKPPRSHHCSVTRQCVLKMDHYCVWVGNTVGLLNYKAFVLFLFWAFLGCVISAGLLIRPCIAFFSASDPAVRPMVTSFLSFVFTAAFALALLGFVVMHVRLIQINHSTIEAYEKSPVTPWPYNRGLRGNFLEVLGKDKWLWLLPIVPIDHQRRLLGATLEPTIPMPLVEGLEVLPPQQETPTSPSNDSTDSDIGKVLLERSN